MPGIAADDRAALMVTLSPGQAHDGVEGRKLLTLRGPQEEPAYLLMDRAYEGGGYPPVGPGLGLLAGSAAAPASHGQMGL